MSDTGRQPRDPAPEDELEAAVPTAHGDLHALRFRRIVEALPLAVYLDQADAQAPRLSTSSPQIESDVRLSGRALERRTSSSRASSTPMIASASSGSTTTCFDAGLDRWSFRYRIVAADGRAVWVRDDAVVITDDAGEPEYVQGFLIDITEEMEREAARTTAEYRYRRLVENLPLAVYLDRPDSTGTSEYISPAVEQMFGYPAARWMEETFFASVLHPDDRERLASEYARELTGDDTDLPLRVPRGRRRRAHRPRAGRPVDPQGRGRQPGMAPGRHDGRDPGARRAHGADRRTRARRGGRAPLPAPPRGDPGRHVPLDGRRGPQRVPVHERPGRGDVRLPGGVVVRPGLLRDGAAPGRP